MVGNLKPDLPTMDGLFGIVFSIIILLFSTEAGIFAFAAGSGFSSIGALACVC
jgi:hypothetical protein